MDYLSEDLPCLVHCDDHGGTSRPLDCGSLPLSGFGGGFRIPRPGILEPAPGNPGGIGRQRVPPSTWQPRSRSGGFVGAGFGVGRVPDEGGGGSDGQPVGGGFGYPSDATPNGGRVPGNPPPPGNPERERVTRGQRGGRDAPEWPRAPPGGGGNPGGGSASEPARGRGSGAGSMPGGGGAAARGSVLPGPPHRVTGEASPHAKWCISSTSVGHGRPQSIAPR